MFPSYCIIMLDSVCFTMMLIFYLFPGDIFWVVKFIQRLSVANSVVQKLYVDGILRDLFFYSS